MVGNLGTNNVSLTIQTIVGQIIGAVLTIATMRVNVLGLLKAACASIFPNCRGPLAGWRGLKLVVIPGLPHLPP